MTAVRTKRGDRDRQGTRARKKREGRARRWNREGPRERKREREAWKCAQAQRRAMLRWVALRRHYSDRQGRSRSVCCTKRKKEPERDGRGWSNEREGERHGQGRKKATRVAERSGHEKESARNSTRVSLARVPSIAHTRGIDEFEPLDPASSGLECVARRLLGERGDGARSTAINFHQGVFLRAYLLPRVFYSLLHAKRVHVIYTGCASKTYVCMRARSMISNTQ